MPFQSQAQRGYMYANHPELAKRWEAETPAGKLPERKTPTKQTKSMLSGGSRKVTK